jgi:hypothetical protein
VYWGYSNHVCSTVANAPPSASNTRAESYGAGAYCFEATISTSGASAASSEACHETRCSAEGALEVT